MSIKEQLTLAAALAVALSSAALWPLFSGSSWLVHALGAVLVVMAAGLLTRRVGVPRFLQPFLTALSLAAYLVVVYAGSTLDAGFVPTGRTVDLLRALVTQGRLDIGEYGPPVPSSTGLLLLTTAGVGLVAVVVDLVAVVLDRAAVAGLPLLVLFVVPAAVLPGGLDAQYFILGAIGWLSLLMVEGSERVGRWGTPMRSALPGARPGGDDSSLGRVGRRIGFAAVGAAVILPLLLPSLDHRLIGGSGSGTGEGTGGSNSKKTYNPITKLQDQLRLPSPVELFQYRTTDPNPDYIRMTTLDRWTGDGWEASDLSALQKEAQVQKGIDTPIGDGGAHQDFEMRVAISDGQLDVYWLPVPFGPRKVDVKGLWLWDARSQTVFSAQDSTDGLPPYDIEASRVLPDRDALALAQLGGVPAAIRGPYGKQIDVTPAVRELTATLTAGLDTEYDKAVALQSYFTDPKNGFVYDLDPSQPVTGGDPLEAFLSGKRGFCEQYATAMAAMLRVAGIPSRVGVGFTRGSLVDGSKDTFSVTTNEAHAWPEAWFAGTGWVRFEPTPTASGAFPPAYTLPEAVAPVDPRDPTRPTPKPTATSAQTGRILDPDLLEPKTTTDPSAGGGTGGPGRSLVVLVPGTLLVLGVTPFLLTVLRRRHRWSRPGPLTAWAQVQDDAADIGHRWHPADSPRAGAARLSQGRSLPAPALDALQAVAVAAERARYAPPGRSQRAGLQAEVAVVRAALHAVAPTPVRLRAIVAPPSTLRWAGHAVSEAIADVLDRVDDVISAVTRPVRRRTAPR